MQCSCIDKDYRGKVVFRKNLGNRPTALIKIFLFSDMVLLRFSKRLFSKTKLRKGLSQCPGVELGTSRTRSETHARLSSTLRTVLILKPWIIWDPLDLASSSQAPPRDSLSDCLHRVYHPQTIKDKDMINQLVATLTLIEGHFSGRAVFLCGDFNTLDFKHASRGPV